MNKQERQDKAIDFFERCKGLLAKKGNDYASDADVFSNFKKIGYICDISTEKTFLMFIAVKIARLAELQTKEAKVNESKEDSLLDIANYACLYSLFLNERSLNANR